MPDRQPVVAVVGGGLAGMATAVALGTSGFRVHVYEAKPFPGGRATSYAAQGSDELIDNCQHILLRCCDNLLDFYGRLGVRHHIVFHREFYWIEPGGRTSVMKRGLLPAPAHFTGSFAGLRFLSLADKAAVVRGLLAVQREYRVRHDLDDITMSQWLMEKHQTPCAIDRFWKQVLVSAINENLDRMAASHGLQVFYQGFLANSRAYEMGVPGVPLTELYAPHAWQSIPNVCFHYRTPVDSLDDLAADARVLAVPFERLSKLAPQLSLDLSSFEHSPITGIHLWFDRSITDLPHATLLDRNIHWLFNKHEGRHIQLVVSASRHLTGMSPKDIVALAVSELKEFFPDAAEARLERSQVVKEVRATFSAAPGLASHRPANTTIVPNLFLAGDWTNSGWPSTMEGAVRSGYKAAEAVSASFGRPMRFLIPA